jgi:hypothetical protein
LAIAARRQRHGLLGERVERGHQQMGAGHQGFDAHRGLGGDHTAVGDRLDHPRPLEVGRLVAVHVQQDARVGEPGVLVVADGERRRAVAGGPVPTEQAQVGAPLPQLPSGTAEERLAPRGAATEEGDVDLAWHLVDTVPSVDRRDVPEGQVHRGQPGAANAVERERADVEHAGAVGRVVHRQVEERGARLLGIDAHRPCRSGDPVGLGCREQAEELVRGDDELVERWCIARQPVDHQLGGLAGASERLDEVLGDLAHEHVAVFAHENPSGHGGTVPTDD